MAGVTHIGHFDSSINASTSIRVATHHRHLWLIVTPGLISVANELDVARYFRDDIAFDHASFM